MSAHPPTYEACLARFRQGRAGREEAREVVRHLLTGCPECGSVTSRLWPANAPARRTAAPPPPHDRTDRGSNDYSGAFARADQVLARHQVQLADERSEVPQLRAELERHPRSRQRVLAENSSRFHNWSFVESLLEDCRPICQAEPEEAAHLASLAINLSERLDIERYGRERIGDLQARSWAALGNVLRVQERYRESERAFARARLYLRVGTGDPVEQAEVLSLEASLWSNRCQFDRAIALIDGVIAIARRVGQRELWARALVQKAKYSIDRGAPEEALPLLLDAQKHLDPSFEPRLAATVQHNILYALVETGRFEEAASGFASARGLYRESDHPIDQIRLDWLEGRVFRGLGDVAQAEARFRHAFKAMLAEELDYDAALVGLDLAVLYSEQNRNAEIRELVAAMLPVFTSHQIHREALAALVVFREAAARERLSTELVQEAAEFMRRAAVQPHLRFKIPPAQIGGG